ncbi:hypothetical protein LRX75_11920 [Rhizobium sp. DKSPLA3]|uniref:Uncharacterized protein n=1 Tax=Rhizobium quercicola TaxID=2901226 RepID=A0A9X1NUU8_9HYPH|nr:hypothetical protein [Rhizobium quercicola]MCD7109743.1 hypothetical protein [Rhizobium quercicola]
MDEWLVLAKTMVPSLEKALTDDRSGTLDADVVAFLKSASGKEALADVRDRFETDPALRERFVEQIGALIAKKGPAPVASDEVSEKLRRLDAEFDKLEQARRFYLEQQARNARHVWVNPVLSVGITGGFIVLVYMTAFVVIPEANSTVFNIILGAFSTAFATVIGFHFGSSVGSKDKDQDKRREAIEQASAGDAAAIARITAT